MRILFVNCSFALLNIIDCGAANRSTLFVKALASLGHVDVVSFYKENIISNVENCDVIFSKSIDITASECSKVEEYAHLLRFLVMPWSPMSFYDVCLDREVVIDNLIAKNHYDLIACRYLKDAVTCGLLKYSNRLVIDVDDNPVSATLRDLKNEKGMPLWLRPILTLKAHALGIMCKNVLSRIRCSFFSSIQESPFNRSIFLHNASASTYSIPAITNNTPLRVLLVGWLDYFPNRNGALHFVEKIFPLIKKDCPMCELRIVGRTQNTQLVKRLTSVDGVKALGFVDNIIAEYENARVIVVPVYQGTGTSVKFIEGLTMNRPVVASPKGSRGFEHICEAGLDYMLAEDDCEFAQCVSRLLKSVDLSNKIAANGLSKARNNFSQQRFFDIVRESVTLR